MLAGVAGLFYASRFGYVNPGVTGVGIEFIVIAGVIIGGTSITGGSGSVLGTFLGILLLGIINKKIYQIFKIKYIIIIVMNSCIIFYVIHKFYGF